MGKLTALPVIPVLVGPTASGKTDVALRLAPLVGAEIVSADSRQIYRFLDIGTAKPTPAERAAVPHHFIDERDPDQEFSAGEFGVLGRERVAAIVKRKRVPLVVGGSGLYVRSLIDGLFEGPGRDPGIRTLLEERLRALGIGALRDELRTVDPESAERATTSRRVLRALEVYHAAGIPLSQYQRRARPTVRFTPLLFGFQWDRAALYRRIEARCEMMIEAGLLRETERLEGMGYGPACPALNTVGYAEINAYRRGEITWHEALERFKRNSRRYAKRQMTWFRADRRIRWIAVAEPLDPAALARRIALDYQTHLTSDERIQP